MPVSPRLPPARRSELHSLRLSAPPVGFVRPCAFASARPHVFCFVVAAAAVFVAFSSFFFFFFVVAGDGHVQLLPPPLHGDRARQAPDAQRRVLLLQRCHHGERKRPRIRDGSVGHHHDLEVQKVGITSFAVDDRGAWTCLVSCRLFFRCLGCGTARETAKRSAFLVFIWLRRPAGEELSRVLSFLSVLFSALPRANGADQIRVGYRTRNRFREVMRRPSAAEQVLCRSWPTPLLGVPCMLNSTSAPWCARRRQLR